MEFKKEKALKILKNIDGIKLKEVYSLEEDYEKKWDFYLKFFDNLEKTISRASKYSWFETSYVESMKKLQTQDYYKYFKRKRHKILEMKEEGKKLSIEKGSDFDKKLSQSIGFEEIREDIITNEHFKDGLILSDEMSKKIEKVTGSEIPEIGTNNFYYDYCEKEVLIIQFLLLITNDIREIVRKLKV